MTSEMELNNIMIKYNGKHLAFITHQIRSKFAFLILKKEKDKENE